MVQGSFELEDISDIQPYCLNAQLNRGVRIEDCFPKGRVAWNIKLPQTPIPLVAPEFDILFVCKAILSEHTRLNKKYGVWDIAKWVEFMNAFWTKFDKKPLVMIGADYDEKAIRRVAEYLEPDQLMLNAAPTDVLFLMSHCRWFLGYQSGMGIHADNLGCRQLMLYFNYLENLKYAWCQYPHENFHGHTFNTPIKTIIDSLPLNTPKIS